MTVQPGDDDARVPLVPPVAQARWWAGPTAQTVALTAALAVAGIALAVNAPADPLLDFDAGSWTIALAVALALAFFVTELGQALVEVGRQAYSFSLSGVPLVLGLLYCPPSMLIAARVIGAVAAFLVQRTPPLKGGYNTASYLLDISAVIALAHLTVGTPAGLTLRTAALCYVSMAVVDLVMSSLVLAVIRINLGPVGRDDVAEVFVSASAFVAVNTAAAFICAVLLGAGPLGAVLLAAFGAVTAVSFRAYLVLRSRHRSLVEIQDFIGTGEGAQTVADLAGRMLPPVRELMRAGRADLTLRDVTGPGATVVSVDEAGTMRVGHQDMDEFLASCVQSERPRRLTSRSHNPVAQEWLDAHGVEDALIVPLVRSETQGTVVVLDRLGDTTHFTDDDLALLQTLAGHLAVALHSVQLFERLLYEATHDALTDLPNRSLLTAALKTMLGRPDDEGRAAFLLLDLDRFKDVNDALGHDIGDQLLQVVASRLSELVPPGATVGRLGGDEFAVLLPPSGDAACTAVAVAESIADALRIPVQLPDVTVSTEGSIGVAVAAEGQSDTDLMRHADTAMYAAKDSGVSAVVYTGDLDHGRAERLSLLTDLRAALDRDELEVRYQPKADLATNVVSSVEALVRWTHPTLGAIDPADFVPLAESTGVIDQLTRVVLATALRECRRWRDAGHDITVAVNLSARNVNDPGLPDEVAAALAAAGVPAHGLILEITESSIMGDPGRTLPTLERLAALGVALSVDDFGTGYSSLSYLQRLPVRELKIDRAFVVGLAQASDARESEVLVRGIIGLGHSLNLRVVAEGVDTAELLEQLRMLGCDIAQGFYLARPMRAAELLEAVDRAEVTLRTAPGGRGTPESVRGR
jgi:diguanylate cyclase (GGDEF)-like protein